MMLQWQISMFRLDRRVARAFAAPAYMGRAARY